MQNIKQKYRLAVHTIYSVLQKNIIQHIRYWTVLNNTKYRHRSSTQNYRKFVYTFAIAYAIFNIVEIENNDRFLFRQFFKTQYSLLVKNIRQDKNKGQVQKVVLDLINKSRIGELTAMQLLALSELVKKPQLNLQAQYIASLK